MAREYFNAYHSYIEAMEPLNDAERGRLFTACLQYSMTGEVPELRGNERFIFYSMKSQIDRDIEAYEAKCASMRANAEKRWDANACKSMQKHATACQSMQGKGEGEGKGDIYKPSIVSLFDRFWKAYPRKVGKGAAEKAFTKINPDEDLLEIMMLAVDRDKDTEQWQQEQYIPHPSTWLNQKRWLDEPLEPSGPEIKLYRAGDPL